MSPTAEPYTDFPMFVIFEIRDFYSIFIRFRSFEDDLQIFRKICLSVCLSVRMFRATGRKTDRIGFKFGTYICHIIPRCCIVFGEY